jgi:hypothetical protein
MSQYHEDQNIVIQSLSCKIGAEQEEENTELPPLINTLPEPITYAYDTSAVILNTNFDNFCTIYSSLSYE